MLLVALALAGWSAGASAAVPSCPPVPGAEALLSNADRKFLVFGEAHGTIEIPQLFGDVVCQASASRAVVVALEWPPQMQAPLDEFMASDGSQAARTRFLAAPFWANPTPDGRTSQAMFDLVERLRRLKADGRAISVQAFAPPGELLRLRQDYYELEMARNLAGLVNGDPSRPLVLVLTGDVHAAKVRSASLGGLLGAAGHLPPVEVLALDIARTGGASWGCSLEKPQQPGVPLKLSDISCGARPRRLDPAGVVPRGITLGPTEGGMYDGVFSTGGQTTASAPPKSN